MSDQNDQPQHDPRSGQRPPQSAPNGQPQYGQPSQGQGQGQGQGQAYGGQAHAVQYGHAQQQQYGQYAQPGQYGQYGQPGYGYPPAGRGWNLFAILAIIFGFAIPPAGIVLGHISLHQIKRTHEEGRPLALIGLIAGYVITALYLAYIVFIIVFIMFAATHGNYSDYPGA